MLIPGIQALLNPAHLRVVTLNTNKKKSPTLIIETLTVTSPSMKVSKSKFYLKAPNLIMKAGYMDESRVTTTE